VGRRNEIFDGDIRVLIDSETNAHSEPNSDADSYSNTDSYAGTNADANPYTYTDAGSHADADTNAHTNSDADTGAGHARLVIGFLLDTTDSGQCGRDC